ncbi:MAG: J domain-containing protein [Treponema sp.]
MKDYYKILEIDKNATQEEIKQKYRALAKRWHPDANGNSAESEEKFKDINEAYSILSSEEKRKEYDEASNPYTRRYTYENTQWQESEPFYTFYYTSNKRKKKNEDAGSILKGIFQIVIGIILFPFPGFFPFLGIYAIFSGIVNIKKGIKHY